MNCHQTRTLDVLPVFALELHLSWGSAFDDISDQNNSVCAIICKRSFLVFCVAKFQQLTGNTRGIVVPFRGWVRPPGGMVLVDSPDLKTYERSRRLCVLPSAKSLASVEPMIDLGSAGR